MEIDILKQLLKLAHAEKKRIDYLILAIGNELSAKRRGLSKTRYAIGLIAKILKEAPSPMQPKDIADRARMVGQDYTDSFVRGVLHRFDGQVFTTAKRGRWTLFSKPSEREEPD